MANYDDVDKDNSGPELGFTTDDLPDEVTEGLDEIQLIELQEELAEVASGSDDGEFLVDSAGRRTFEDLRTEFEDATQEPLGEAAAVVIVDEAGDVESFVLRDERIIPKTAEIVEELVGATFVGDSTENGRDIPDLSDPNAEENTVKGDAIIAEMTGEETLLDEASTLWRDGGFDTEAGRARGLELAQELEAVGELDIATQIRLDVAYASKGSFFGVAAAESKTAEIIERKVVVSDGLEFVDGAVKIDSDIYFDLSTEDGRHTALEVARVFYVTSEQIFEQVRVAAEEAGVVDAQETTSLASAPAELDPEVIPREMTREEKMNQIRGDNSAKTGE